MDFHLSSIFNKIHEFEKNVGVMNIHLSIQGFALGLFTIFIPVFLINMGFCLNEIFIYYIIFYFCMILFSPFAGYVSSFIGFKKIIFLRPLFLLIFIFWLYSIEFFPFSIYALGVFNGFTSALYWVAFHFFFLKKTKKKNVDMKVGWMYSLPCFFRIFAPVLGGFVLAYYSYNLLFLIGGFFLFLSIIPLFYLEDYHFNFKMSFDNLFHHSFYKYFLAFFGDGIGYFVGFVIFPLYIYFLFNNPVDMGLSSSLVNISGVFVPLLISYLCKDRESLFIKIGVVFEAVLWIIAFYLETPFHIFLFSFFLGIAVEFWAIPFNAKMYNHARKSNTLEFLIFREMSLNIGRIIFLVFIILFDNVFSLSFVFGFLSRFLFLLI